jgi:hypothetical protein
MSLDRISTWVSSLWRLDIVEGGAPEDLERVDDSSPAPFPSATEAEEPPYFLDVEILEVARAAGMDPLDPSLLPSWDRRFNYAHALAGMVMPTESYSEKFWPVKCRGFLASLFLLTVALKELPPSRLSNAWCGLDDEFELGRLFPLPVLMPDGDADAFLDRLNRMTVKLAAEKENLDPGAKTAVTCVIEEMMKLSGAKDQFKRFLLLASWPFLEGYIRSEISSAHDRLIAAGRLEELVARRGAGSR